VRALAFGSANELADFLRQDDPIAAKVGFIPRNSAE
jgi:hypothetical protein